MVFLHIQQGLRHVAAEGAEIAGVGLEGGVADLIDQLIKRPLAEGEEPALPPLLLIGGNAVGILVLV